ncbi:gliding-associated putative ABC transporter substrate-binding component GldG [Belliella baltica DSM 15883]|uniref:Gliding-associated putative ABC transporter substrate-binding component GldG n=1 Tax=Belliella baltica (strain DSM 15883 / CIP 108006 / LMG 21964 / BA134) TaxID=866536 RepID=I3Z1J2_BELBD|nr:gliding motility-associated ABC transporter substrate-binding protein GldG [Belliella baltica]AFL83110.1 gliding-associated putative ABC transporter substrate-binding component GldG [Belliella baltica DSM 15883]
MKNKSSKQILKILGVILLTIVGINVLFSLINLRIDLTEEKRYSLHPATIDVLENLEEPLEVEILLNGDLPGGMRRLQRSAEQMVRTFNSYSSQKISFSYLDPLTLPAAEQEDFVVGLTEYGIQPTNLFVTEDGGQKSKMIFPGVLIKDVEYETGALILRGEKGMSPDEILNNSVENLEYELINAIRKLVSKQQYAVGMLMGNGELEGDDGFGIVEALVEDFEVFKIPLDQAKKVDDLDPFDVLIISGPKEAYDEREIYLVDQYLMKGGNLIILPNSLAYNLDEAGGEGTVAMPFENGLDQLLFRYGVRVNKDFVQDMNFGYHPVMAGNFGDQQQLVPLPWPFYIAAGRMAKHPVTKGLDQVIFRFTASLDTVKADGVKKTPLIFGSDFSRKLTAPVRVAFQDMENGPELESFGLKNLPLLYLLEGEFTSVFKNRFLPVGISKESFLESGKEGRVLVAGTGGLFESSIDPRSGEPLPLGIDPFSDSQYANRLLLQNMISYLVEPDGIIATRTKQYQIRPLNKVKVSQEKTKWQLINVILPVVIIGLLSLVWMFSRKGRRGAKDYS